MMNSDGDIHIHCFDVGHGDSIVIEFPNGQIGIVDCNRTNSKTLNFVVKRHGELLARGDHLVIAFICLTHPHLDHYSGFPELYDELIRLKIEVQEIWDFGVSEHSAMAMAQLAVDREQWDEVKTFTDLVDRRDALRELQPQCERRTLVASGRRSFRDIDAVTITALAPDEQHKDIYQNYYTLGAHELRVDFLRRYPYAGNHNFISSALHIAFGSFRLVLGGDLMNIAWSRILEHRTGIDPRCHAIKVSHHGSSEGSFPNGHPLWPYIIMPDSNRLVAFISGGYRASLPDKSTLQALLDYHADVYVTGAAVSWSRQFTPTDPNKWAMSQELTLRDIVEIDDYLKVGHGDIWITGNSDGTCKVVDDTS